MITLDQHRNFATERLRRISARSRYGFPVFAMLGVARSRLAQVGHRIAAQHRNSISCKRIFLL